MSADATGNSSLKVWVLTLVAVFSVATITFSVHRFLVERTINEAAPLRVQRDSARRGLEEQRTRGLEEQKRRDTLAALLVEVEKVLQTRPNDSLLVIRAANIAYDLEDFATAESYYRRYLKDIDKSNIAARIDLAYVVFRGGRTDEGIHMLQDVLRQEPKNQMAMFNLAFMFDQTGNKVQAKKWVERCMQTDSTSTLGRNAKQILSSK